jgi:putative SOS response-associated peptidase YedK
MVITQSNKFVAGVHDRMPVMLEAKDFEQWEHGYVKDAAALMRERAAELASVETREQLARPTMMRVRSSQ